MRIPTHIYPREDAVYGPYYDYVPTTLDTKWVATIDEFRTAGGVVHFNGDQTEVVLTLPEGFKFSCQFIRGEDAS